LRTAAETLDLGGDDHVTKLFGIEALARIRTVHAACSPMAFVGPIVPTGIRNAAMVVNNVMISSHSGFSFFRLVS
jgi:DNA-binding response OmpR family regulator